MNKKIVKELENFKTIELSKTQANYINIGYIGYSSDYYVLLKILTSQSEEFKTQTQVIVMCTIFPERSLGFKNLSCRVSFFSFDD